MDNMGISGYHMNMVLHVEYLKLSQKDSFEVTRLAAYLTEIYGGPKVSRGKLHDYLGMHVDYSAEAIVKVSMIKYLKMYFMNYLNILGHHNHPQLMAIFSS